MRFHLNLNIDKQSNSLLLPLNYQYECSALIYKILFSANKEYASWLHSNGFEADKKQFKLFTFSRFYFPKYRIRGEFIEILSDYFKWQLSFLPERSTQDFVQGLFKEQEFEIGNRLAKIKCHVSSIEMQSQPLFTNTMKFETLSPMVISLKQENGRYQYIDPNNPMATELVKINLISKYQAIHNKPFPESDFPFELTVLNKPKPTLITIKAFTPQESKIKGYMCRFQLKAPVELMEIMYEAGIGGKNSVGFGMVEERYTSKIIKEEYRRI